MAEDSNKTARDELKELVRDSYHNFIQWLRPSPIDGLFLRIIKTILKIPVALFILILSPVLILVLGIIFVILL